MSSHSWTALHASSTRTGPGTSADQMYNQTNIFVYPGENVDHNTNLSIEVDQCICNARCSFREYTLELYVRPSVLLELKLRMLRTEVLKTLLYDCVTWSPCACHYDTLRRTNHSSLIRCLAWRKKNLTDHTISYLDTLIKTRSESIEETMRRRWILFAGFVARMEDTRLPQCVVLRELMGVTGCLGGGRGWEDEY